MQPESKPNFTAWFVMQGTMAAMRQPDLQDSQNDATLALYRPLSDAASKTRFISRLIHSLPPTWQYRIGGLVTHPDRLKHFCFRKKEIEKQARRLLEAQGITQVIILGAGLDVLSLRLAAEYPAVKFIEIDTPESQHFKAGALSRRIILPDNVEFIPGDLREPLSGILEHSALHKNATKTLWIAEGFFMFIPEDSVVRILREIREHSAIGSHIIFTSLPSYKPASFLRYLLQTFYLRKEESSYRWAIAFNEVLPFMEKLGYQEVLKIGYDALQGNYLQQRPNNHPDIVENIHVVKM